MGEKLEKKKRRGIGDFSLLSGSSSWAICFSPLLGMTREPGGPWFVDAHVNMVIPGGWLSFLIHPAINLLLMAQILSFPPHCPQQSRENYSIDCLAVAGVTRQGGTALLCQTRDINFSCEQSALRLCAVRQGSACMREIGSWSFPWQLLGGVGKVRPPLCTATAVSC